MFHILRLQLLYVGFVSVLLTACYAQLKRSLYWLIDCITMFQVSVLDLMDCTLFSPNATSLFSLWLYLTLPASVN